MPPTPSSPFLAARPVLILEMRSSVSDARLGRVQLKPPQATGRRFRVRLSLDCRRQLRRAGMACLNNRRMRLRPRNGIVPSGAWISWMISASVATVRLPTDCSGLVAPAPEGPEEKARLIQVHKLVQIHRHQAERLQRRLRRHAVLLLQRVDQVQPALHLLIRRRPRRGQRQPQPHLLAHVRPGLPAQPLREQRRLLVA